MREAPTVHRVRASRGDAQALRGWSAASAPGASLPAPTGVVSKPWGYEYLFHREPEAAAWILQLHPGTSTSLHAHVRSRAALLLLRGDAVCHTLSGAMVLHPGDAVAIGAGVVHRVVTDGGATLLEVEAPGDKRDIVRIEDRYGRAGTPYEAGDGAELSGPPAPVVLERHAGEIAGGGVLCICAGAVVDGSGARRGAGELVFGPARAVGEVVVVRCRA